MTTREVLHTKNELMSVVESADSTAELRDVERHIAAAIEVAKKLRHTDSVIRELAETRIFALHKLGKMLAEIPRNRVRYPSEISRNMSSDAQKIASVDKEKLKEVFAEAKKAAIIPSVRWVVRTLRGTTKPHKGASQVDRLRAEVRRLRARIKELEAELERLRR